MIGLIRNASRIKCLANNAGPILSMFKFITMFKQRSPDLSMDFRSVDNGFKQLHESIYARIKVISGITQLSQKNKTNTPIAYNEI